MQHSRITKEHLMSSFIAITPQQPSAAEQASEFLSNATSLVSGFVLLLAVALAF